MPLGSILTTPQVDGAPWKRQRKMTATCFSEQNNQIVWSESLYLAKDMLRYWTTKPSLKTVADDTRTLSLHVLSRAGFGKSFPFEGHDERQDTSPSASYKASLQTILENCVLIMALGTKFLAKPWLPRKLRVLHESCVTFQGYMTELYEKEKRAVAEGRSTDKNLMNSLVRASQDEARDGSGLTEQEIYSNLFVFNFAGHDTTAHTFTFAIYFLAAHPDVQGWVRKEVLEVLGDSDEWSYTAHYPRLKRCLSVMLETVRLYTPVPVAKWTDKESQTLDVGGGKTVVLPPDTMVIPSYASVHTDPRFWGSDSLGWRPSRWVDNDASAKPAQPGQEELISPRPGTYLGWSEGARDCPGRKFSQVEFVATLATLLKDWGVDPVLEQGESPEAARQRVADLIEQDSAPVLILQMLHPDRAPLRWTKWAA
jgi:cytochrome P450